MIDVVPVLETLLSTAWWLVLALASAIDWAFTNHLFISNLVSSSLLLALGDFMVQTVDYIRRTRSGIYDLTRTGRTMIVGFILGIFNHVWYSTLDHYYSGQTLVIVAKKIALDQAVAGPFFCSAFILGMSLLEGKSGSETYKELSGKFLSIYKVDLVFWPTAQFINFFLISEKFRVFYVNFATLIWNTFLSYVKHNGPACKKYDHCSLPRSGRSRSKAPSSRSRSKSRLSRTKSRTRSSRSRTRPSAKRSRPRSKGRKHSSKSRNILRVSVASKRGSRRAPSFHDRQFKEEESRKLVRRTLRPVLSVKKTSTRCPFLRPGSTRPKSSNNKDKIGSTTRPSLRNAVSDKKASKRKVQSAVKKAARNESVEDSDTCVESTRTNAIQIAVGRLSNEVEGLDRKLMLSLVALAADMNKLLAQNSELQHDVVAMREALARLEDKMG